MTYKELQAKVNAVVVWHYDDKNKCVLFPIPKLLQRQRLWKRTAAKESK